LQASRLGVAVLLAILLGFAGLRAGAGDTNGERPDFTKGTLLLDRSDGTTLTYEVEFATTPRQHAYGLMHLAELAPNAGMLFVFNDMAVRRFWMKNTLIPLDILFFDEDGRFVSAVRKAEPGSLASRNSDGPAKYVLELNGGQMEADGIDVGATMRLPVSR